MQLVVVMAVKKAVSAATITFATTSMIFPFFIMFILSFASAQLMGVKGVKGVKGVLGRAKRQSRAKDICFATPIPSPRGITREITRENTREKTIVLNSFYSLYSFTYEN